MEAAQEKDRVKRAQETTEQHDHLLEQCGVQEEAARQRETPTESESRRVRNGTRYIITALSSNLITAKRVVANDDEPLLLIPRVIHLTKNDEFPFVMKQVQFPAKLAYVMTFQRAQGQSLEKCEILLNRSVCTHGQLYVVMSRCGAMSWVIIYANQAEFEELNLPPNNHYTCNVVYTEVFNLM